MKVLILGAGSIGTRHVANLRTLRPDTRIVYADPAALPELRPGDACFADWRDAIRANADAGAAIIASPTAAHFAQMYTLVMNDMPFYVEKPIVAQPDLDTDSFNWIVDYCDRSGCPCAVGHQYRFHSAVAAAAPTVRGNGYVKFYARDNLLQRYGADCLGVMTAHPIDTALWLLGPARSVVMRTDGMSVTGKIVHDSDAISEYDIRMDESPRVSTLATRNALDTAQDGWALDACNEMYLDALAAWLQWLGGGERDERTATLEDGLAVVDVMSRVDHTLGG